MHVQTIFTVAADAVSRLKTVISSVLLPENGFTELSTHSQSSQNALQAAKELLDWACRPENETALTTFATEGSDTRGISYNSLRNQLEIKNQPQNHKS